MAVSVVQAPSVVTGTATFLEVTLTGVTAGNTIVSIAHANTSGKTWTPSDDKSNTYNTALNSNGATTDAVVAYASNVASGTTVVRLTASASTFFVMGAMEVSGLASSPVGNSSTYTDPSVTTSHFCADSTGIDISNGSLVLGTGYSQGTVTSTSAGSSYTGWASGAVRYLIQYRIAATALTGHRGDWTNAGTARISDNGMVEFLAAGSGPSDLACDAGSYTVTGNAATLTVARVLTCNAGSYSLTGQDATLTKASALACDAGIYTLTGNATTLTKASVLDCAAGSYTYTGQDATLTKQSAGSLACDAGTYTVTGYDATLTWARTLDCAAGSYTVTGQDATLTAGQALLLDAGSYTLTGYDVSFVYAHALAADAGSYSYTGYAATLTYSGAVVETADDSHTWATGRRDPTWATGARDTTWRM